MAAAELKLQTTLHNWWTIGCLSSGLCTKIYRIIWDHLRMRPADERRYIVTLPLIGWAHTQNDHPWLEQHHTV